MKSIIKLFGMYSQKRKLLDTKSIKATEINLFLIKETFKFIMNLINLNLINLL